MKKELSAIAQDSKWLLDNGYKTIDLEKFSGWVTRDWNDCFDNGVKPNLLEIQQSVVDKMLSESI